MSDPHAPDDYESPRRVVWETPPRRPRRGRPLVEPLSAELAAELRAHPGTFARYNGDYHRQGDAAKARSRLLTSGRTLFPADRWEVATRKVGDGVWRVYIRWAGRIEDDPLPIADPTGDAPEAT